MITQIKLYLHVMACRQEKNCGNNYQDDTSISIIIMILLNI